MLDRLRINLANRRRFVTKTGRSLLVKSGVRTLYNILFTIFFVLASPYYFMRMRRRGSWRQGFAERFGKYNTKLKQAITNRQVVWMHAVSVGEVNLCTQLIRSIEERLPNLKIVVSTTTTTGMARLQDQLPSHVSKIYYPIDRKAWVSRALSTVRPEAIVLVEAEIWPNFLWRAGDSGRPVFLVNARLSERSYRGYRRFSFLFKPLFRQLTAVGAQSEADATRLRELGCRAETIHIVGSLKFDGARLDERRLLDVSSMLRQLGVPPGARLLVGGSTHAGEEAVLADLFLRLRARIPDLFLVLVPRHFERGQEVGRDLSARGLKFTYRSEITPSTRRSPGEVDCLVVNTTGELRRFYEHATVVFVGKSLTGEGGQNPIEPGALGKAMVFGPNMQNFAEIVRSFLAQDGAEQARDAADLEKILSRLLDDPGRRDELGRNALKVVQANLGAVDRTAEMIIQHLPDGIYVPPKWRK
jgi:3-deoxy-D-manno-octulosonic-acid transferase